MTDFKIGDKVRVTREFKNSSYHLRVGDEYVVEYVDATNGFNLAGVKSIDGITPLWINDRGRFVLVTDNSLNPVANKPVLVDGTYGRVTIANHRGAEDGEVIFDLEGDIFKLNDLEDVIKTLTFVRDHLKTVIQE